jgi:murein DD-endopeptidase MepM/ murein hydrolase activator NlpD
MVVTLRCRAACVVLLAVALAGCGARRRTVAASPTTLPPGYRYTVKAGENLFRIGLAYGIPYRELAAYNGIPDPAKIEVGQVVVVPNATRELPVQVITPLRAKSERPATPDIPVGRSPFLWPVEGGKISSRFGPRGETHHDGVDIQVAEGAPVRAVRAGRVIYSDELRGYGNIVIVEHDGGYATVYGHNRINRATVGEAVAQGQVIAEVGQSGDAVSPQLHFEVRKDNVARNPMFYLPRDGAAVRTAEGRPARGDGS